MKVEIFPSSRNLYETGYDKDNRDFWPFLKMKTATKEHRFSHASDIQRHGAVIFKKNVFYMLTNFNIYQKPNPN